MARPISSSPDPPRILLVEGQTDQHVVLVLCARHQLALDFEVRDSKGIDKLLPSIGPQIKVSGRQIIGILVDADGDRNARWDAVANRLSNEGIEAPKHPDPTGTIIDPQGKPRVGIWLMPDNKASGELEDFVVQMIPAGDRVWPLSQRYIEEIPEVEKRFSEKKKLRAQLYAWLAARKDPRRMETAIEARDLEVNGELSQKFIAWLTKLFG